jgi:hypothetical protein
VDSKEIDADGEHVVHITTFARNQRGADVMPGHATVALPSREDATSPAGRRTRVSS